MRSLHHSCVILFVAMGLSSHGMAAPIYSWGRQLTNLDTPGGPLLFLNYGQSINNGNLRTWGSSGSSIQNPAISWNGSGAARVNGYSLGASANLNTTIPSGLSGFPSVLALTAVGLEDTFTVLPGSLLSDGFMRFDFLVRGSASYSSNDSAAQRSLFIASFDFQGPTGSIGRLNGQTQFPFTSTINGKTYQGSFLTVDPLSNYSESVVSLFIPYSPTITLSYLLRAGASTPFNLRGGTYSISVDLLNTATLVGADLYAGTIQNPGERIADAIISGSDGAAIPSAIPEPATGWLLLSGAILLTVGSRRRRASQIND